MINTINIKHRILIFDYDGVLVDSLDIFMNHFIDACQKEHFPQINNKDTFLALFNNNLYESMLKLGMSLETILRILYRVREGLLKDQHKINLFSDIPETLSHLAVQNTLYVITSNDTEFVTLYLKKKDLTQFEGIIGSDQGGSKVEKISFIQKKFPQHELYYVGDTLGDIKEGKRAGIHTVAITWGWHTTPNLKKGSPDYMINHPRELTKIF